MPLEVTKLDRVFKLTKNGKVTELSDPGGDLSPEEVVKVHSATHPELTNAVIEGPKVENDKAIYNITTNAGRLG